VFDFGNDSVEKGQVSTPHITNSAPFIYVFKKEELSDFNSKQAAELSELLSSVKLAEVDSKQQMHLLALIDTFRQMKGEPRKKLHSVSQRSLNLLVRFWWRPR